MKTTFFKIGSLMAAIVLAFALIGCSSPAGGDDGENPFVGSWVGIQDGSTVTFVITETGYMMTSWGYTESDVYTRRGDSITFMLEGEAMGTALISGNTFILSPPPGVSSASITFTRVGENGNGPVTVPNAPTGVSATVLSSSSIQLTWNAAPGATSYKVYYTIGSSTIKNMASGSVSGISYIHSGLQADTTYYYYIKALNNAGESSYSNFTPNCYATTQPSDDETSVPGAPTGVTALAESSGSILISWTAPSSGGTPAYYNIWRSSSANGTYTEIDFVFAPDTSYTDTGLNPSTTYYYKVEAENMYHERGSQSSYASATTQPLDETSVPSAPTGVTATAQYGGIQVMWDAVPGATSYKVYARDPNSLVRFNLRATPTTPGYLDAYVEAGERQYYRVTAVNDAGESEPSVIVSAAIASAAPATPSNLRVLYTTGSSIGITWDASPNATGYILYRSTSSSGSFSQVYSGAMTEYTNINLSKGTTYYFRVTAQNSAGESQPSSVFQWTTFNF